MLEQKSKSLFRICLFFDKIPSSSPFGEPLMAEISYMNTIRKSKEEITDYLSSHHVGMQRKSVELFPYQTKWPIAFEWVKMKLAGCIPSHIARQIEHVGSTSIPGLSAKPFLDILVLFTEKSEILDSIPFLETLGFIYKGDAISVVNQTDTDPNRHFFSFYNTIEDTDFIHLHVMCNGHPHVRRLLAFRDALRADQNLSTQYEDLKISLWKEGLTRHEYTRSKNEFIEKVLEGIIHA